MLPEYEKAVFIEYVNQQPEYLIFTNSAEVTDKSRELKEFTVNNSFDFLSDLLGFELREVEAMQEAIETREQYERKPPLTQKTCAASRTSARTTRRRSPSSCPARPPSSPSSPRAPRTSRSRSSSARWPTRRRRSSTWACWSTTSASSWEPSRSPSSRYLPPHAALQATPVLRDHQQDRQDGAQAPAHLRRGAQGRPRRQPEHQVRVIHIQIYPLK